MVTTSLCAPLPSVWDGHCSTRTQFTKMARRNKNLWRRGSAHRIETVGVWYHPQLGVRVQTAQPTTEGRQAWKDQVRGFPPKPWTCVASVEAGRNNRDEYAIVPGQSLPKNFLFGDPDRQKSSLAPRLVYGPIERKCSTCKEVFVWPAHAQKHLYETLGAIGYATAQYCQPCVRKRRVMEDARTRYADALIGSHEMAPTMQKQRHRRTRVYPSGIRL